MKETCENMKNTKRLPSQGARDDRLEENGVTCTDHLQENKLTCTTTDSLHIPAGQTAKVGIRLSAANIGRDSQTVVFSFASGFEIGRVFTVNVVNREEHQQATGRRGSDRSQFISGTSTVIRVETQNNWVIRGSKRKQDQPPSFIKNQLDPYPVPTFLFERAENEDFAGEVVGIYPALLHPLCPDNYERYL